MVTLEFFMVSWCRHDAMATKCHDWLRENWELDLWRTQATDFEGARCNSTILVILPVISRLTSALSVLLNAFLSVLSLGYTPPHWAFLIFILSIKPLQPTKFKLVPQNHARKHIKCLSIKKYQRTLTTWILPSLLVSWERGRVAQLDTHTGFWTVLCGVRKNRWNICIKIACSPVYSVGFNMFFRFNPIFQYISSLKAAATAQAAHSFIAVEVIYHEDTERFCQLLRSWQF